MDKEQILRDLFGRYINLRNLNEGRDELSKDFKKSSSQRVFIFVDNALKQNDLEKLLPITDLASLPAQSRILLTTRNLNETQIISQANIEVHSYAVAPLQQEDARKLLCKFALESGQANFDPTINVEGLLQICQGIPLVLKIAGAKLRAHAQNIQTLRDMVEYLRAWLSEGAEGEISERLVDFVYTQLKPSCKEAFLDIVFFFCNWERSIVAFSVGESEFQELERAALVNITYEGKVNVHDIVKARGRMLSPENGERITDVESLIDVLQDAERTKKTKGICLSAQFELEASHLNLMKRCLRVLILTESTRIVNGECKGVFQNLRLLSLDNHNNYSRMDVTKNPRLAVFILDYIKEESKYREVLGVGASSLKYMYIYGATLANLTTTLSQLQSLRSLTLQSCRGFDSLPETTGNLHALDNLDLWNCSDLAKLPDSFGNLSSLKNLDLRYCSSLLSLSESFGNLGCLERLILFDCAKLSNLPQNFGQLKCLKYLSIVGCKVLQSLSRDFECLSSLIAIRAAECDQLEENTMDKLAKMKGLMIVDIRRSPMLERRWEQVKEQCSLVLWEGYLEKMRRLFFHRESKWLDVDENGQIGESGCPEGHSLSVLLTACDLTSASNSRYLEAVKRKWMEDVASKGGEIKMMLMNCDDDVQEEMKMIYVDCGGSWEESEGRVREILPHLAVGTTAWIAPDNRAYLHFAYELFEKVQGYPQYIIVGISTSVDEEGRKWMEVVEWENAEGDYEGIEYGDNWEKILSPISEAHEFLVKYYG